MNVIIFGSGPHANVLLEIILSSQDLNFIGFVDEKASSKKYKNYPIFKTNDIYELCKEEKIDGGIIGVGDNAIRFKIASDIKKQVSNFVFINLIHPNSYISQSAKIGFGNVILNGSIIGVDTEIGNHCIINTNASIDHDCTIKDCSSIAPGATLGGNVQIGKYSAIGIGSSVKHGVLIEDNCIVGGGSFVNKNLKSDSLCYGVPCKEIKEHTFGDKYL